MPLLQTVTSALLLHFSRLHLISSRGSSIEFSPKMAISGLPAIMRSVLLTCLFTVTTVTKYKIYYLKTATAKGLQFVTATSKTPFAVTLLLQSVTNCNNNCNKRCNIFKHCISISYKICYSRPSKNLYLRIYRSKN